MRKSALFLLIALPTALIGTLLACVGDDPAVISPGSDGSPTADTSTNDGPGTNPGSDSEAPIDAAGDGAVAFDVRALPGLRLWLESSQNLTPEAVGSTGFGSWRDSSGRWDGGTGAGRPDSGYHLVVPHQVNPPSIVANGFAGRPTVSFTAGNGYLRLERHPDFDFGTGDFLIAEVAKIISGSGPLWRFAPNASAGSEELLTPGSFCWAYGLGVMNGCTTPAFTPSTEAHVFVARRKSSIFAFRVDASQRGSVDITGDPGDIQIGPFAQDYIFIGNNVTMQVSEVVVIVGPTTDADSNALETHLKAKYLIP